MLVFNVANGDGSAYYSVGYETRQEAMELLRTVLKHDPRAHVVVYERQTEEERLRAELEHVKRERDAAVEDLCEFCYDLCKVCISSDVDVTHEPCKSCGAVIDKGNWQWRGVKEG